jgi:mono/diheme cytochrome c family protein
VLGSLVVGFALLGRFRAGLASGRYPALRRLAGLAGVGLVVTSSGLLWLGSGAILHPEQWGTSEPAFRVLLTWSGVGRFGEFTLLSFAGTGAILQRLGGRSPAPDEARFASRLGSGLALAALAAWPLALLFSHANLPSLALSVGTWGLAAAGVAVAAIAAWLAVRGWTGAPPLGGRALLAAAVVLLGAVVGSEQLARESVLVEAVLAGLSPAPPPPRPPPSPPPAPAPAPSASAGGGKVAAGKAVFDRICHLCHRFDARVVGPPLDAVVPKYRKDPEALRAFLRSPVKKDPAYPAMPKPAVTEAEIDAVAAYLLAEAKP